MHCKSGREDGGALTEERIGIIFLAHNHQTMASLQFLTIFCQSKSVTSHLPQPKTVAILHFGIYFKQGTPQGLIVAFLFCGVSFL